MIKSSGERVERKSFSSCEQNSYKVLPTLGPNHTKLLLFIHARLESWVVYKRSLSYR